MGHVLESSSILLLDQLPLGIVVYRLDDVDDDRSLRLVYANPAASKLTERDLGSLIGRTLLEVVPAADPDRMHGYAEVCRSRKGQDFGEIVYGDLSSGPITFSVRSIPVLDRGVALVIESLSSLKRAEAETGQLNRFLDSIVEHLPAMVFLKDAQHLRFTRFNRAGEDMLGVPRGAVLGKSDHDLFPAEQADFFVAKDREVLASGTLKDIPEEPIDTPHGQRWLHTRKIPILGEHHQPGFLLGVSIDITERKRAEELLRASHQQLEQRVAERTAELQRQIDERIRAEAALALAEASLRQSQRMEAIGRLAGGVAHDFNNLLGIVLGLCESALQKLGPGGALRGDVEQIEQAAVRGATLTAQLLAFSRQQILQPCVLDLNSIVSGLQPMLPRLLGEDVQLAVRLAEGLRPVKADPGKLEQVLMNLLVNARDAMPEGGRLNVETSNAVLAASDIAGRPDVPPGHYVRLAVTDTGIGMDADTVAHVFDPFFTTKERGKGTGLGLSTAFGIVKQSGGAIWVASRPGEGTRFEVYFPVTEEPMPAAAPVLAPAPAIGGAETIVLVEDDAQLRAIVSRQLQRFGYRTLAFSTAAEALAMAGSEPVDLLLTDLIMPVMGGRQLAEGFLRQSPSTRVLFMSGYTDDEVVRDGALDSSMAFLQKPFTPDALGKRIRSVLAKG